jgi:hypothetical protein
MNSSTVRPLSRMIAMSVPRAIGRPGWLGTVTRRRVSGLYQISWLPFAYRSKTNPALRRARITSLAVREGARVMGRR